jgi:outer membrane protein TolC
MRTGLLLLTIAFAARAQGPLSLREATQKALDQHPALQANASQVRAAEIRVTQARAGYLPRVDYSESWQRSNNPVFVFSSLLTQHQFTESNFQVGPLNRPDALNNFQSLVTVEQLVYDGARTRARVGSAQTGSAISKEQERATRMELLARAAGAYYGSVLAAETARVASEAVRSAQADLERAEAIRAAGMSTDADVLSIRVHLAAARGHEIRARETLEVARAGLNEALGEPIGTLHELTTPLAQLQSYTPVLADFETKAAAGRPESLIAGFSTTLAEHESTAARSALLPQVSVRGIFEADRQQFVNKGGANWLVAASVRWNLFNGGGDRARIAETEQLAASARSKKKQVDADLRLSVHRAWAGWQSAQEQITVASAAVTMAEESLRIIKNRYEGGLSTVTDLLRNEVALLETRNRDLAALYEQRMAAIGLELAAGTLTGDSNVLQ